MTFDDKVDLVLKKMNGSEGTRLAGDIQTWLTNDYSNPVDNQLIINLLEDRKFIRLRGDDNYHYLITARGRRVNDKGGWLKYLKVKKQEKIVKNVITYSNIFFAIINIAILLYSLNQSNRLDRDFDKLESKFETKSLDLTKAIDKIDLLEKIVQQQKVRLNKTDSLLQNLEDKRINGR
jgi:hypothetical protein